MPSTRPFPASSIIGSRSRRPLYTSEMWRPPLSRWASVAALALCAISSPRAQESDPKLTGIDFILDTYVRDGEVYYRALKSDRARLDTYVASLATAPVAQQPRDTQL